MTCGLDILSAPHLNILSASDFLSFWLSNTTPWRIPLHIWQSCLPLVHISHAWSQFSLCPSHHIKNSDSMPIPQHGNTLTFYNDTFQTFLDTIPSYPTQDTWGMVFMQDGFGWVVVLTHRTCFSLNLRSGHFWCTTVNENLISWTIVWFIWHSDDQPHKIKLLNDRRLADTNLWNFQAVVENSKTVVFKISPQFRVQGWCWFCWKKLVWPGQTRETPASSSGLLSHFVHNAYQLLRFHIWRLLCHGEHTRSACLLNFLVTNIR